MKHWHVVGMGCALGLAACSEPVRPVPHFWPASSEMAAEPDAAGAPERPSELRPEAPPLPPVFFDAASPDLPPDARRDSSPPPDGPPVTATCRVQIEVRTVTTDLSYAPRNIGAIWVAAWNDRFVKTLKRWASRRIVHLTAWNEATTAAGARRDVVDAVSAATERAHKTHVVSWNCGDNKGARRRQEPHQIFFEMTESNSADYEDEPTQVHSVEVTPGAEPFAIKVPDAEFFKDIKITYTP